MFWLFLTAPMAVCHHNGVILVALGPRVRPKDSRKHLPEIVPKDQRLHVTEVPNSFGSQVEHNLQNAVKITFSSMSRPKTSHIVAFCYNPPPTRRQTEGPSPPHPSNSRWVRRVKLRLAYQLAFVKVVRKNEILQTLILEK